MTLECVTSNIEIARLILTYCIKSQNISLEIVDTLFDWNYEKHYMIFWGHVVLCLKAAKSKEHVAVRQGKCYDCVVGNILKQAAVMLCKCYSYVVSNILEQATKQAEAAKQATEQATENTFLVLFNALARYYCAIITFVVDDLSEEKTEPWLKEYLKAFNVKPHWHPFPDELEAQQYTTPEKKMNNWVFALTHAALVRNLIDLPHPVFMGLLTVPQNSLHSFAMGKQIPVIPGVLDGRGVHSKLLICEDKKTIQIAHFSWNSNLFVKGKKMEDTLPDTAKYKQCWDLLRVLLCVGYGATN